jgi:hypothetical protein
MNRFFGTAKPKAPKPTINDAISSVWNIINTIMHNSLSPINANVQIDGCSCGQRGGKD